MILSTAMLCLALNIYHEARGEPVEGQHAVAQVTMNRAGRDPKKVCDVVFEKRQFSWANPLTTVSKEERVRQSGKLLPKEDKAWVLARSIAFHTIKGNIQDFTKGATHYHTVSVRPAWRRDFKLIAVIGQHRFYRV